MKKLIAIILTIVALITVSAVVYAKDLEFHEGVYRGEKWEFDFGQPKKNNIKAIGTYVPLVRSQNSCESYRSFGA